jgi:hypothetical protein
MPEAFTINLGFKDYYSKDILLEGMLGFDEEDLIMGPHTYDGSYTMVELKNWSESGGFKALDFKVQSAHAGNDLVILVEPTNTTDRLKNPLLLVQAGVSWNKPGEIFMEDDIITGEFDHNRFKVFHTGNMVDEEYTGGLLTPHYAIEIDGPVGISTGKERSLEEIKTIVGNERAEWQKEKDSFGEMAEVFDAIQTVVAWNVVYEPKYERVVCPVSRRWSYWNRGYVQYCWDTYFAGYLAAATNSKEVAYINLVEMTRAKDKAGTSFVPNVEQANGFISRDRSQPPVGSLCALEVYNKYQEKWILELLYPDLLEWNEWWKDNRQYEGLLSYGSTPYEPVTGAKGEVTGAEDDIEGWMRSSMESGWDGAALYEEVPFDEDKHFIKYWDASLNSLYVMDSRSLAKIAEILGKDEDAAMLYERASKFKENIPRLWNQEKGFFYNKNWETGEFSNVTAINGFYPLIAGAATGEQAKTIVENYFYNPNEFWGQWIIPTLSRSHPVFEEDTYWDGRVWPPTNFLVYIGLKNYEDIPEIKKAKDDLVLKSRELLMKDWKAKRYVRENYEVATGSGDEENVSAKFYHWGGLLGLMSLIEEGQMNLTYSAEPIDREDKE